MVEVAVPIGETTVMMVTLFLLRGVVTGKATRNAWFYLHPEIVAFHLCTGLNAGTAGHW